MVVALSESREAKAFRATARTLESGPNAFDEQWLAERDLVVLPQESALHFDANQCRRLAGAFEACGVRRLMAVPTEEDGNRWPVLALDVAPEDLEAFSFENGSFNYVLIPAERRPSLAVLCSTDDFFLVAGPREFVSVYAGDIAAAAHEYLAYVEAHFGVAQPPLRRAAQYLSGPWAP